MKRSTFGAFTSTTGSVEAGLAIDKAKAAIAELGPMPERLAVGFIVSQTMYDNIRRRFPPDKRKRKPGDTFGNTPIVVDPAAPAGQCKAIYTAEEWARRLCAIAKAKTGESP